MNLLDKISDKELLVFDVDGVILNSVETYVAAVKFVCEELGYKQNADKYRELAKDINYENKIFPTEIIAEAKIKFKNYTNELKKPENFPVFPGVNELLETIKSERKKIAFFSSKSKEGLEAAMDYHNFREMVDIALSRDCVEEIKPSPEGLISILNELNIQPSDSIMFGDADLDFESAKKAEVDFIGVNTGTNKSGDWNEKGIIHISSITEINQYI